MTSLAPRDDSGCRASVEITRERRVTCLERVGARLGAAQRSPRTRPTGTGKLAESLWPTGTPTGRKRLETCIRRFHFQHRPAVTLMRNRVEK